MFDKIKQQLKEYEDAAAEYLRLYWMNSAAAEALKRLLEEEQPTEEQPEKSEERYCEGEI